MRFRGLRAGSGRGEPRQRRSRWLWWVYLGVGLLSWVGFLIVAVKMQNRRFTRAAVIAFMAAVACVVADQVWRSAEDVGATASPQDAATSTIGTWIVWVIWAGLIVYGHVLNREYKEFLRNEDAEEASRWQSATAPVPPPYVSSTFTTAQAPPEVFPQPTPNFASNSQPPPPSSSQVDMISMEVDRFLGIEPPGNEPVCVRPSMPA